MAICHRMELRVYDRTGTGSYSVLPASQVKGSWALGGGGFVAAQAESRAEPLASAPRLLDDCVIKVALPLSEPGTSLTEVMAYANRGRAGVLWGDAGQQIRQIRQAGTLFTVWSQDAILHPEGNTIAQMTAPERYFGWMSTVYNPADDAGRWGTPSANAGQQDSTTGARAGQPADWPTELGNAYWITRGTTANGTRHLFVADCVVPSACYLTVYYSADESVSVYFGGSLIGQTSSSETGYQTMGTWSAYVQAGTYRVGIDKTSVISRGGDGRDPVLLAVATNDDTGGVASILLQTNTTDWKIYTTDPVDGSVPSLTPGAIVTELASQAVARGVDTWEALTLDFNADTDSAGQTWPLREERAWRVAYDRHLDMIEGLGDLGFCPEITPGLVFKAWGNRGTDRSATVTLATLDEVDRVDESGTGVAGTYMPVETQDGWVIVENPAAAATYGRRETALSLGNAPSIAQGKRLGQKVLDDRLAKPETERTVQFYARAGSVPFVDFFLGDTVSLTVGASTTKGVVLDLGFEADHTEAIVRWTAKVTGDGISGETRSARFATEPAQALAEGGVGSLVGDAVGGAAIFSTMAGSATAAGGTGSLIGAGAGAAIFSTRRNGAVTASGAIGQFIAAAMFQASGVAQATAAGGAATFIPNHGRFMTEAGAATAGGDVARFMGNFMASGVGVAAASGGTGALAGDAFEYLGHEFVNVPYYVSPVSIPVPAGVREGDLLVALLATRNSSGSHTASASGMTFTAINVETGAVGQSAAYGFVPASVPSSVTFATSGTGADYQQGVVMAFRGVHTSVPVSTPSPATSGVGGSWYSLPDNPTTIPSWTVPRTKAFAVSILSVGRDRTLSESSSDWTTQRATIAGAGAMMIVTRDLPSGGASGALDVATTGYDNYGIATRFAVNAFDSI